MKEIYDWVPWFSQLAQKIAEKDNKYLIEKAKNINWKEEGTQGLLNYGDNNIDPFSFVYTIASYNTDNSRDRVYSSVTEVFELAEIPSLESEHAFTFPTPIPRNLLFHGNGEGNPELLWRLFRSAVVSIDKIDSDEFDEVLKIKNVGLAKLTQALFLINPSIFCPFDECLKNIISFSPNRELGNLDKYKLHIGQARDMFPSCDYKEINLFAYLQKDLLSSNPQFFQIGTDVYGNGEDYWDEFNENNWVRTGGPTSINGKKQYPVKDPKPGNVVLVRRGMQGRGIGIVLENDYKNGWKEDARIHVVWINKEKGNLETDGAKQVSAAFSNAKEKIIGWFKESPRYKNTFLIIRYKSELINDNHEEETRDSNEKQLPLNQILFGPPGTGKTYKTKGLSLKIIGKHQGENDADNQTFKESCYNPEGGNGQIAMITFHQNYAYEDFIEGIKPKTTTKGQLTYEIKPGIFKNIAKTAKDNPSKRYVLIIDEINRGNIAKIFGELITLIEDSRRLGREDETTVTLPYSGEEFGVPRNLYLLGTMNTADRSILLLDTALRRRFTFAEMMPVYKNLPEIEGINLSELLKTINERITVLLDREHQIGHTYLMNIKTIDNLAETFQNKIFPLLQEYFFNDWNKIHSVLGKNSFVVKKEVNYPNLDIDTFNEDQTIYARLPDSDKAWTDPDQYRKVYQLSHSAESELPSE